MSKLILSILFFSAFFAKSQRLDFGMDFLLPFASSSIVSTKYNYISDDPVVFNFAKIKKKTQYTPEFNLGLILNAEYTYKMFGLKLLLSPMMTKNRSFSVYFPHLEDGEQLYTATVEQAGFQIQPLFKFSFKTFKTQKIALLAGGYYFNQYGGKASEYAKDWKSDISYSQDILKYLLWDDTSPLYGFSFGIEHNVLMSNRKIFKHSLTYNTISKKYGYNGFKQAHIQYQVSFFYFNMFNAIKRNKIYLE